MDGFDTRKEETTERSIADVRLEMLEKRKEEQERRMPKEPEKPIDPVQAEKRAREKKLDRRSIFIVLLGMIFIIMKLTVPVGIIYPTFEVDSSVIPETQLYTLNLHYGAEATYFGQTYDELSDTMKSYVQSGSVTMNGIRWNNRVDLFNDFIGYLLMAYGCFQLKKRRGTFFKMASYSALGCILLKLFIVTAPFYLNGIHLVWASLFIGIANFFLMISVTYLFVAGICQCLYDTPYQQDRTVLLLLWLLMFVVQTVVAVTTWVLVGSVTMIYNVLLFFLTAGFVWKVARLSAYIVEEDSVPNWSLKEIYLNSDRYRRRVLAREQRTMRKNATKEIAERRKKMEEAKKRAEGDASEKDIPYQDAGIKKIRRKDVIDRKQKSRKN